MQLRRLTTDAQDLEALAHFIFVTNSDQTNQINYFGDKEDEILHFLSVTNIAASDAFVLAFDNDVSGSNKLVGVLGFDYTTGANRVLLFGPLVTYGDWQNLADELWTQVQKLLPAEVREIEIFCNILNERCQEFALRHQFPPHSEHLILRCGRTEFEITANTSVTELTPYYYSAAATLHEQLFPASYLTGADITGQLDANHKLFGIVEGNELLGYTYCQIEEEFGEANIEYVGVNPAAQGRGLGSQLVRAALNWFFSFERLQEVFLVTATSNLAAIRVYQKAGFTTLYTTRSYRKKVIY